MSFKNEITFSFEATNDKRLEDYHVVQVGNGVRLLKLGVVNGPNASGKSNLLYAFEFLKQFWFRNVNSKLDSTRVLPFMLDSSSRDEPTRFKLSFYIEQTRYVYCLELNQQSIITEKLDYYPSVQPANVFNRTVEEKVSKIEFGPKIKINQIAKDKISIDCLHNISVFAAYSQVNINIPEIEQAIHWMQAQFMNMVTPDMPLLVQYAERTILQSPKMMNDILCYLQQADFNISELREKEVQKPLPDFMVQILEKDKNIPIHEVERLKNEKTVTVKELAFMHRTIGTDGKEAHFPMDKSSQSEGTLRALGLGTVLLRAIEKNAFLCIDEIEAKLHPHLIEFIFEQFIRKSKRAQILVATHYDGLYDEDDMFRNDNFWFVEKKTNGVSDLYSLSDFKALNRISSKQKAYRLGKFGAIPNIS